MLIHNHCNAFIQGCQGTDIIEWRRGFEWPNLRSLWMDMLIYALLIVVGDFIRTKSITNPAYACKPSTSHPIAGNSLKNLLVVVESLAREASSNFLRKIESRVSRASRSCSEGGRWLSAVGYWIKYRQKRGLSCLRLSVRRMDLKWYPGVEPLLSNNSVWLLPSLGFL